ncbi:MAG: DUF6080 domain-containing protein [Prevotella fusca]|uniref:DUF6080 domain-containing protein n=1 Tax=Prevotella fusca TaxID=589436 RepID=UPI003FA0576E
MRNIFAIKRGERLFCLVAVIAFIALNGLMVAYNFRLFTKGGNLGFWGLFFDHYTVSGFDNLSYMTMSRWKIYYQLYRHPLLPTFFYPFYYVNHWLMDETGTNFAVFIEAFLNVIASTYSSLFIYRIFKEVLDLSRKDAVLLTVFFFSFASILLTCFVPDHFVFSLFFLTVTLYIAGRAMKREKGRMKAWQTMLLTFFATGITCTNIAKIGLADLFVNGKRTFRIKYLFLGFILPLGALFAIYAYQQTTFVEPDAKLQAKVKEKKLKKDRKFAAKYEKQHEFMKSRTGTQVADNRFFEWTDLSSSRTDAIVENLFGESIQLHQKHVLEDVNKSRPIIVRYSSVFNYIAELLVFLLFLGGIIVGWRDKFLRLCLLWFATDIVLHIVLGFGIIEVYIMGAHWLFVIPIAVAFLFKRIRKRQAMIGVRLLVALLAIGLMAYNLSLIIPFMLRGFVAPQ